MNRLLAPALAVALAALPGAVRAQAQAGSTPEAAPPAAAGDEIEFVEGDKGDSDAMPLPKAPEVDDNKPPLIEDLAVAAGHPATPPMITAVITDDWSGVERAEIYYRAPGQEAFSKAALAPGAGGLFIGRLPDGLQRSGFQYYVEVWDAAQNGPARMGGPEAPLVVEPAREGTLDRIERQERELTEGPVHPGWVMLSMGAGIAFSAASGWFWYDLFGVVQPNLDATNKELSATNLTAERRAELLAAQGELENSRTGDVIFGSILGVVGVAAVGTGVALMIASIDAE